MKNKKRNRESLLKDTLLEFIFEAVWNVLMYIPRIIIRFIARLIDDIF